MVLKCLGNRITVINDECFEIMLSAGTSNEHVCICVYLCAFDFLFFKIVLRWLIEKSSSLFSTHFKVFGCCFSFQNCRKKFKKIKTLLTSPWVSLGFSFCSPVCSPSSSESSSAELSAAVLLFDLSFGLTFV